MKNKLIVIISFIYFFLFSTNLLHSADELDFNVTEIDITKNGNLIVGSKGGKAITNDGLEIEGENFIYNKITKVLNVSKNVKFTDTKDGTIIISDKATYFINEEVIFTEGNSKAINKNNTIIASKFKFNKITNVLNAEDNVKYQEKS